jgi:hypothetical protein
MRRTARLASATIIGLSIAAMLWPAELQAQSRRTRSRLSRPIGLRSWYYRPYYYRPFFYPSYFYSPFYWGAYGWYPYGPFPPYAYYGGGYRPLSSIRVQATPREAQVYVDGYFVGLVDDFDGWSQRLRLEPGEYVIQLYLEGYRTATEKLLLRPDSTYKLRLAMEKLGPDDPAPSKPEPSPTAAAPRYQPRDDERRPRYEGRRSRRPYDRPGAPEPRRGEGGPGAPEPRTGERETRGASAADYGTLAIRVQPDGAVVRINGEPWEGPETADRLDVQLPTGRHRVEIARDGYRSYSADVEVQPGEVTTLNVVLTPE